jgi:hypothetical protein
VADEVPSVGFGDDLLEQLLVDGTRDEFGRTVGVHDHERRLVRDLEPVEHVARIVTDLRERQAVTVDEVLEVVVGAGPCDADEVDLVCELRCDLLDRGGFTVADASSGRPEPERRRHPGDRGTVEGATADEGSAELQDVRHDHRIGGSWCRCVVGRRRVGAAVVSLVVADVVASVPASSALPATVADVTGPPRRRSRPTRTLRASGPAQPQLPPFGVVAASDSISPGAP